MALSNKTPTHSVRESPRRRPDVLDLWDEGASPLSSELFSPSAIWLFLRRNALFIGLTALAAIVRLRTLRAG